MKALVKDRYDEVSYKVFNIGNANLVPAYSSEIGVPMDGRHIEAVERDLRGRRRATAASATSTRARRSRCASSRRRRRYASMMHGRDTMMIELIQLRGNEGGYEMLQLLREGAVRRSAAARTGARSTR